MEITLTPDTESKLEKLAADRGRTPADLARDLVERYVADLNDEFLAAVDEGIAAADAGDVISNEAMRAWIDQRFPPR